MTFEIPVLTYSEIGKRAHDFLLQYHPSLELPVPIETIIDVQMGLNIIPFPNLYKDHSLNGYLSSDRTSIFVDEVQSDQFDEKYRYTLAHELGHYLLHQSCYENLPFRTTNEYVEWRGSLTNEEISWFETHGDWFAGHVLVPTYHLETVCREVINKHQTTFAKFAKIPEDFWSYVSNGVATYFEVNAPVVEIRIKKENIPTRIQVIG